MNDKYVTRDSGERVQFDSGMVRDVDDDKLDYDRVFDGPMIDRWAGLLTRGAVKYKDEEGQPNWMKANGEAEMVRFRKSAVRHLRKWRAGETDEDHAAAVIFNLNGYEYVKERMQAASVMDEMKQRFLSESNRPMPPEKAPERAGRGDRELGVYDG